MQKSAEAAIAQMGISFTVYSEKGNIDRLWPFDVFPRTLEADEWEITESGLKQRLKALNHFIEDVYNEQRIFAAGIIPLEVILSSRNYRPECRGMKLKHTSWVCICGSDLVRGGENMRTTRDILPREAWIQINELYLLVKESQGDFEVRGKRNALLDKIIRACQAWSGMLSGTMSENETYRFIKLGMSIERADMTTRLLDVGGLFIAQESFAEEDSHFDAILWAHLLKSAGVYFMYRQQVQTEICGERVVDFLMKDPQLARSVAFCVQNMRRLVEYLPNAAPLAKELDDLQEAIKSDHLYSLGSSELHDYLDWIQARLSSLHGQFYAVWFNPMAVA